MITMLYSQLEVAFMKLLGINIQEPSQALNGALLMLLIRLLLEGNGGSACKRSFSRRLVSLHPCLHRHAIKAPTVAEARVRATFLLSF